MRVAECLGKSGPLCEQIDGYQVRDTQVALAQCIEQVLEEGGILTAEAGTGIGKTFAYLVPALSSGDKVIVSTGTRHLQDQLFHTDLPRVIKALGIGVNTALLKGRNNYLCLHRLNLAPHLDFVRHKARAVLHEIERWSRQTASGDIAELPHIAEDDAIWPMVTSTADNCLGGECDHWSECFVVKARKTAQEADLLVINHHLLLADMTLKEDGFAELLPEVETFIIDEAHQLHDVASRFFGETVSTRQLTSLARDVIAEQVNDAPDMADLREQAEVFENTVRDFRLVLGDKGQKDAWRTMQHRPAIKSALQDMLAACNDLLKALRVAGERSRGLDKCADRCEGLYHKLRLFENGNHDTGDHDGETASAHRDGSQPESAPPVERVLWYETYTRSFTLHATPVDIAGLFRLYTRDFEKNWIFTSATLQVNQRFEHFIDGLGLSHVDRQHRSGVWESPFDYRRQSLLYRPADMPVPASPDFTRRFIEAALPVLAASGGRAFLLFTSYRAMHLAYDLLQQRLDYPLFMQGELAKHTLLERFRTTDQAILLGTASFWEGVDVRGSALSCVMIDKLPFAAPGDPVIQARIDLLRERGEQPFFSYQIPQAVIALKQGVGRLIRDVNDHGVVMIGDPRLYDKPYGKIFLNSLPDMPRTGDLQTVVDFLQRCRLSAADDDKVAMK